MVRCGSIDPVDETAPPTPRPRRRALLALLAACAAVTAAAVGVAVTRDDAEPVVAATTTTTSTTEPPTTTTTVAPTEVPASTDLATPKGEVPTYDRPEGTQIGTVGLWYGYPMTMPIVQE